MPALAHSSQSTTRPVAASQSRPPGAPIHGPAGGPTRPFPRTNILSQPASPRLSQLKIQWLRSKKTRTIIGGVTVVVTLAVACLALWPAFAGNNDSQRANDLARWSAKLDFYQFCESHGWIPSGCNSTQRSAPGPPPSRARGLLPMIVPLNGPHSSQSQSDSVSWALALPSGCFVILAIVTVVVLSQKRKAKRMFFTVCRILSLYTATPRAPTSSSITGDILGLPEIHSTPASTAVLSTARDSKSATSNLLRHRLSRSSAKKQYKRADPALWDANKAEICHLYLEGHTVEEVRKHMKIARGFRATKRQYAQQLMRWEIRNHGDLESSDSEAPF